MCSNFGILGSLVGTAHQTSRREGAAERRCLSLQIAAALKGNERLEALDINGNNVGPEGLIALANALKGKESLERLEISYNPIEASGAKALIDVIKFDLKVSCISGFSSKPSNQL